MQLEQMTEMYQPMQCLSKSRQTTYFVVEDLESLSASALYTGKIIQNSKGVSESVQVYKSGTIKSYVDLLKNEIKVREQLPGQEHKDQIKPLKIDKAY